MKEERLVEILANFLLKEAEKEEQLLGLIRERASLKGEEILDKVNKRIREILEEMKENGTET